MITLRSEALSQLDRINDTIAADAPLRVDQIDTLAHDPERTDLAIGDSLDYFEDTELDVSLNVRQVEAVTVNPPLFVVRFLRSWNAQETEHGNLVQHVRIHVLGRQERPVRRSEVDRKFILAGKISQHIPGMRSVVLMDYLRTGAMHERQTAGGYRLLSAKLRSIGEFGLATNVIRPILRQEGGHSDFYNTAAKAVWSELNGFQRRTEKRIARHFYSPVGAYGPEQQAAFGGVVEQLTCGAQLDPFVKPVEALAAEIFGVDQESLPRFVLHSIQECLEDYRETLLAA